MQHSKTMSNIVDNWNVQQKYLYCCGIYLRLLPFYREFSKQFSWGDADTVELSAENIFSAIGNSTDELRLIAKQQIPILEQNTPDMDDFHSELLPSLALDATAALLTTCDYILSNDDKCISEIEEIFHNTFEFIDSQMDEFLQFALPSESFIDLSAFKNIYLNELKSTVSEPIELMTIKNNVRNIVQNFAFRFIA